MVKIIHLGKEETLPVQDIPVADLRAALEISSAFSANLNGRTLSHFEEATTLAALNDTVVFVRTANG